mmetsp:Transcript_39578/g.95680  ORF Transcript_39578/g.95680 Transcript_39578/m.95680 type:complete len:98 (+) Transcript_39578:523-816(+)
MIWTMASLIVLAHPCKTLYSKSNLCFMSKCTAFTLLAFRWSTYYIEISNLLSTYSSAVEKDHKPKLHTRQPRMNLEPSPANDGKYPYAMSLVVPFET